MSADVFLAFAEALPEPIYLLRASGEILAANQPAWALLAIEPSGRPGAMLAEHVEDRPALLRYLEQCAASRCSLAGELVLRAVGGGTVACRCDGAQVGPPAGGPGALLLRCRPWGASGLDEAGLEQALREKNVQAGELHHRVKNNLQVLLSIIGLAARDETDERTRQRLIETRHRVLSMAVVQKLLHQSDTHASVSGAALVGELCGELGKTFGRPGIELRVDAAPVTIGLQAAAPVALILNELVSNALRHAFAAGAGGKVVVSLQQTAAGDVELCVADDGRGMPEIAGRRLSSGLNLARGLARQLGGELSVESGKGTRCLVRFVDRSVASAGLRRAL